MAALQALLVHPHVAHVEGAVEAGGAGADHHHAALVVAHAGAGLDLRRAEPSPARIRAAVEACLGDSEYRRAARSLADEFAVAGGAARGADLIEASMRA